MTRPWWRGAAFYESYVRSFADSNDDGIGDLPGITSKLEYVKRLGVNAIWLTPFYPSPQKDHGYDVADYYDVNPEYGTLVDFDELLASAHERGLKVLVDLVPNRINLGLVSFGGWAVSEGRDPWLCDPASRRVCLCRERAQAARSRVLHDWIRTRPSDP